MAEFVYLNGSIVPLDSAAVPVLDSGFLYGYGLFETMRAREGRVFRIENHLKRLRDSAVALGIRFDTGGLQSAISEVVRANGLEDARVRLTVSAGVANPIADPSVAGSPTVLILATKYVPYSPAVYERGFHAVISGIRRNSQSPITGMKSTCYLESVLSYREAISRGCDEAVLLNEKGFVVEASRSNVFMVREGVLKTPRESSGLLPGITREVVLELADQSGISFVEENISVEEFRSAQEAFLTNSLIGLMPLTTLDAVAIGKGVRGALTASLIRAYERLACG